MEFINRVIHALTELHPTHPMLVHFPIALTGAAFLFILLAYWRRNAGLEQAAFANIVLAFSARSRRARPESWTMPGITSARRPTPVRKSCLLLY